MAKLQKTKRQSERHGEPHHEKRRPDPSNEIPIKLSPAEIRAANNLAQSPKKSRHRRHSSHTRHARTLERTTTPPHSPTRGRSATAYEEQTKRASTRPLPTPPQSPVVYYSKIINPQQQPPNFSVPRSVTPNQSYPFVASPTSIRPSNSRSSTQGLPTYRGHEMTRSGSFTLIQRPSKEIVGNPLSQFSRPRRSGSQPPAMSSSASLHVHVCDHEPETKHRSRSADSSGASKALNASLPPMPRSISPVSFEANRSVLDFSVGENKRPKIAPSISSHATEEAYVATARPISMGKTSPAKSRWSFARFRRHSLQAQPQIPAHAFLPDSTTPLWSTEEQGIARPQGNEAVIARQWKGKQPETSPAPDPASLSGVRCCGKCGRFKKPYNPAEFGMTPLLEDQPGPSTRQPPNMVRSDRVRPISLDQAGSRFPRQVSQATSPNTPRRPKHNSGVSWPDNREEGKIRPPQAPKGLTRFASLRGFTTEGAPTLEAEPHTELEPESHQQVSGTNVQGSARPVNPNETVYHDPDMEEVIRRVSMITDSNQPDTGLDPSGDEPSWTSFYGVSRNATTPPQEAMKYDFDRHLDEQPPTYDAESGKTLPANSSTDADAENSKPLAAVPPNSKPNPSQVWSGLHTAVPATYRHQTRSLKSISPTRNDNKSQAAPWKRSYSADRNSRNNNPKIQPSPRGLTNGPRSSMTLKDLIVSKGGSSPNLATNSMIAVVDDIPAVPSVMASKANEGRQRAGPNRAKSYDVDVGKRRSLGRGVFDRDAENGDLARGFKESDRLDELRFRIRQRADEVMAI